MPLLPVGSIGEKEKQKYFIMKKSNKITWWVAILYNLLPAIFFASWWLYSDIIARAMPKANGEPFEDAGMLLGMMPAFITMLIGYKIFLFFLLIFCTEQNTEQGNGI